MELIKIAVMGLNEAKELQKECQKSGVKLVLNHNDQTCTRGCAVTVEVHSYENDLPIVQKIYSEKYEKMLEGMDVNLEQMNEVFDSNLDEAICPACGTKFSTKLSECSDCGLAMG